MSDALDKASRFPVWVTEQIQQNQPNVHLRAWQTLPLHRRLNVERQLERVLQEEDITMTDDEYATWINEYKYSKQCDFIRLTFCYCSNQRTHEFPTISEAAAFLQKRLQKTYKHYEDVPTLTLDEIKQTIYDRRPIIIHKNKHGDNRDNVTIRFQHGNLEYNRHKLIVPNHYNDDPIPSTC